MSWWQEQANANAPLLIGAGSAFFMAALRIAANKRMTKTAKVTEALTCAGLSTAFCEAAIIYANMPSEGSVFVGTFIGWLGTDLLKTALLKLFDKFLTK